MRIMIMNINAMRRRMDRMLNDLCDEDQVQC